MTKPNRDVASIFSDALACETPEELARFLEEACGSNVDLRQQVEKLLAAHREATGFLGSSTASLVDPSVAVGKVIGNRYKLLEEIGQGGMGSVWVAEQTEPVRRKVAIKLVKAGMDSKQVLVRFQAERQALALMDHPNIAKVLDGGVTENGRPYFAMEYVKGVPITTYCDECHLPLRQRLKLFVSVCQAVQHAHQKGIIHRDLKPSNILVCQYDGVPVVKVIDFGLAKAVNQPLTAQTLHTAHGIMIGTPLYMSPEQAEFNNLDVDTRTDVYSLGVVLYELLTGSTPLEKKQVQQAALGELIRLIKEVEPARPSTKLSGSASLPNVAAQRGIEPKQLERLLRGDLDWIVMKSLEKDRSRRYETANGMARDIERFLADEAVEACPPSAHYRLRKVMRRYRGPLLGAAAVSGALVLGIFATTTAMLEARRQAEIARVAARDEGLARTRAERAELQAKEQLNIARAEKARADQENARALAANNFMRNLLGPPLSGSLLDKRAHLDLRVSEVLTGAEAALNGLDQHPQLELDGRLTLAAAFAATGTMDRARTQYQRAAELSETLNGADSDATLQIHIDYLLASQHLSSPEDMALGERIVNKLTERRGADDPLTCDANNSLAALLVHRDRTEEAIEIYNSLIESARNHTSTFHPKGKARFFFNLADLLRAQGRRADADRLVIEGCAICDKEPHTDPGWCYQFYHQLAEVHARQGRLEEAEKALRVAFHRSAPLGVIAQRADVLIQLIALNGQLRRYERIEDLVGLTLEMLELQGLAEYGEALKPTSLALLAEAMLRTGKTQAGEYYLEQADKTLRSYLEASPDNLEFYLSGRVLLEICKRGTYDSQSWPSPAMGSAFDLLLFHLVRRHLLGPTSPAFEWDKLTIALYRWEGPETEVATPTFHGSLEELSRFDPPEGLYLLVIELPRTGTFAAKDAIWFLECDWDLGFYDATSLDLSAKDIWGEIDKATPFEQRRGPVASWERLSVLDSFARHKLYPQMLVAARTRVRLPPGDYQMGMYRDGVATWWVDGEEGDPTRRLEFKEDPRELKYVWHSGMGRCSTWVKPFSVTSQRFQNRIIPTVHWVHCDLEPALHQLEQRPGDVNHRFSTVILLCRAGKFAEAMETVSKRGSRLPDNHHSHYVAATLAAYMDNLEEYRKLSAALIDRYPEKQNSTETGERTAKCCLLFPQEVSGIDPQTLTSRVDRAANEGLSVNTPWYYLLKALHLYRSGDQHAAEAIEWLDRSLAAFSEHNTPAFCYYLRAMALEKSGQPEKAAEVFRHAERYLADRMGVVGRDDLGIAVENWIMDQTIAREARAMFKAEEQAAAP